jgi:hypothetical protein
MISDPKLPFDSVPAGVETRTGLAASTRADEASSKAASAAASEVSLARAPEPQRSASRRPVSGLRVWLRRIGVLFFVFICATIGVMLMIVPWRPEWSENPLLLSYPALHDLVASGFTRGLVTGLGLLNVWIGFWEALQYHEE